MRYLIGSFIVIQFIACLFVAFKIDNIYSSADGKIYLLIVFSTIALFSVGTFVISTFLATYKKITSKESKSIPFYVLIQLLLLFLGIGLFLVSMYAVIPNFDFFGISPQVAFILFCSGSLLFAIGNTINLLLC